MQVRGNHRRTPELYEDKLNAKTDRMQHKSQTMRWDNGKTKSGTTRIPHLGQHENHVWDNAKTIGDNAKTTSDAKT